MQRGGKVSFNEVADLLRDLTSCNTYVVANDGNVLGYGLQDGFECDVMRGLVLDNMKFPHPYMEFVNGMEETHSNISHKQHMCSFDETKVCKYGEKRTTIIPIRGNRERIGTLILARYDRDFNDDDLLLGEYAAAVIGIQLLHNREAAMEERIRKEAVIKIAFTTLSFSEWEAIVGILTELKSNEGILIASKVADRHHPFGHRERHAQIPERRPHRDQVPGHEGYVHQDPQRIPAGRNQETRQGGQPGYPAGFGLLLGFFVRPRLLEPPPRPQILM